ncbi:MAG: ankyrin repeat domain-containing protein [Sedimentisphaerales bacterium]|nr:ankyrin repeat domain-containing protein [Sedimentisphaerales bacterium]
MNNRKIISMTICTTLVFVTALSVLSYANNKSGTNTEAEGYFEKANELRKTADYKAAITEYNKVINAMPNSRIAQDAQYWIAQSYFEMRQFDTSLSEFKKLLDGFPDSPISASAKVMIERTQQAKKNRALFEAVKKGDIEPVKSLIAEGADIDAKWSDFYNENEGDPRLLIRIGLIDSTPLWHAADSNNIEMVKLLVEEDPNMNAGQWPPLCRAVNKKNTAIAEYLIDHGSDVNYPKDWGPLQEAACNNFEMVKLLVSKGADVNGGLYQPTIHAGVRSWSREIVEFLIQHGADVNAKDEWGRGYTPLQRAAWSGNTEIIKLLLEAGADISAKDDRGQTVLHLPLDMKNSNFSQYWLSKDTIELLLNKGTDVNLKDKNGRTPLHLAAESADVDIIKLLLDKGADVNTKDDESGFTALHYAARLAKKDIVELLIAKGADINDKDKDGRTPLYIAVNQDYKIAELLINKGADSSIKTESGKTLLQLTKERKQMESTVPDMVFDGEPNSLFGSRIVCGDVDGDGYDDILIDARKYDSYRGRVCLYYGGPNMDTKADLILEGQNEKELFGDGIACGDIDNDGYDDIVIAAGGYNESRGRAYLYWGSDRKSMDVKPDEIFVQEAEKGSAFSLGYPAIYDIDNDGYRDIILGACAYWSPGNGKGRAYLYYGNKKELMDTSADLIFTEETLRDQFGHRIVCGDIDNDGFGDIVIGTIDYPRGKQQDRTYIYYGGTKSNMNAKADITFKEKTEATNYIGGIVCIDQNKDGYDDLVIGDPGYNNKQGRVYLFYANSKKSLDTEPDVTFQGDVEQSDYGIQVICGDIDGDNVNDIVIGTRASVGRVYVYWGNELSEPNPKPGRIFTGENPDDGFGFGLASGDVNNDGYDDIVIGALKAGANQGRAYLYYGRPKK